ncbi:MAG: hypothetical protein UX02_C0004G0032 [Candidatus Moranbacteria bacterium GW2011_GWC1_45_18]|nr:MAG: hypothetical protein UT79_C0003G0057 [Candidatus Moranbacteria bacterium GW2011_GWC2_40_12]KKT33277.1 MAG: hypothetical protein UW19_C0010G0018 [Candidatus Moranbacteria bacterium GW2011_GWF2_44_10]KKT99312.1 MAG: hypothetical protein UX02_C0004G0032 [Candidatus Moranbacteria bacterium GW2011_GWC1_45_18]OGI36736.1 MAG: hypothetical protein A2407_02930 [Candidatus Moranbacteria bacterium RIFOXYC1_FULL_44_8]OGI40671.1 MAG: hypothetical protein A2374_00290 [Candidatus Moranbacteria bacteri
MGARKRRISVRERIAYLKVKFFTWLRDVALRSGYVEPITSGSGYNRLLKAWKNGDVVVGDLIYISKRIYILAGMNRNGGPGQAMYASFGMPTPEFIPATPWERRVWTSFDTLNFPPWSKIGHREKEEWDGMCSDAFNRMLPVVV